MTSKLLIPILLLFTAAAFSQNLTVNENIVNPSSLINDGILEVKVHGGTPPYSYKWSNQSSPLTSNKAFGLGEGVPYSVVITDSICHTVTKEYKVPMQNIS